ncbi:MAG TPA: nucleoside triphosphate pyrophosphohydrolase [Chitinophagaceae bacterium]|nr:nucleoside triphosphate pyrophosphohydrolase [Chitinophagaceae bacterium]
MNTKTGKAFLRLVEIMNELREKCPWDRKQTIQSLRQMTIEETYELADAITNEDWQGIKEELGDLLLHILFYSKIGEEKEKFILEEVINGICEKLVARHPHIYGDPANAGQVVKVNNEEDVKKNWENLKLKEGKASVLSGVPQSLPAMVKAMRLQEKAKQVGFEWDNKEQVWEKVEEEIEELQSATKNQQFSVNQEEAGRKKKEVENEFGDVVFSLINYARFLQIDAENALELTNKKFIHRFTQMEQQALQNGKDLNQMTLQEMDAIWNAIKQQRE